MLHLVSALLYFNPLQVKNFMVNDYVYNVHDYRLLIKLMKKWFIKLNANSQNMRDKYLGT